MHMIDYKNLEKLHFAVLEAINVNTQELPAALNIVEQLKSYPLVPTIKTNWCSFYETRRQI